MTGAQQVRVERIPPELEHLLGPFLDVDFKVKTALPAPQSVQWVISEDELRQIRKWKGL